MKTILRFCVTLARTAAAACVIALTSACTHDAPPDFPAVPAANTRPGVDGCPDLTGTFELAGTALGKTIAGRQPPQTHGLPVVLTFAQGPSNIEGWWVVPRERLAAFANDQSKDAPKRYATWRGLVLKEHLPETLRQNFDAYLAAVAEVGPPGPTYAMVVNRGCRDHWMLVYSAHEQVAGKDGMPREVERETWLARDAAGALLARHVTYTLKSYSLWAPATQYIRTSRSTEYERVAQAQPENAAPLVAADLPPDPSTVERPRMTCAEVPERVNAFSQRLNALLPPKTQVTRFSLKPIRQQDADGRCPFAVVDIEIAGDNTYFLARTEQWLRAEPAVDSVEILRDESGRQRATTRRFRVVLH